MGFFLDWLGFKSVIIGRILEPAPLLLIENGKLIKKNLEKEFMTEDELTSQLRQQGLENADSVKKCYLESNGHFSVILQPGKQKGN
ncbi:hypothetical protein BH10ACI3_BH10ACI3_06410 [soil metagenome]